MERFNWYILYCSLVMFVMKCETAPKVTVPASGKLTAALVSPDEEYLYLFTGDTDALRVSQKYKSEGRLAEINILWSGLDPHIDAAINDTRDGDVYFFHGNQYTVYKNNVKSGPFTIQDDWPQVFRDGGVDAAGNKDGKSYFFKGCSCWTPYDKLDSGGYLIHDLPTLGLPCDVDAAWEYGDDMILSKDNLYWKWSQTVTGPYKLNTFLELCSIDTSTATSATPKSLPSPLPCNGDPRLCPLPIDQITVPGSHNSGSGFAGPFYLPPCLFQNHEMSILKQLRFGMRYLDVDPCWAECGNNLGTCHGGYCSGLLCSMMVQIRTFLEENPTEIVMVMFNHEMTSPEVLIPELIRQIEVQLSPFLNSDYRKTGKWPTLEQAVRTGKTLFVFIASKVTETNFYQEKQWIIDEAVMPSTYTEIIAAFDCLVVVNRTREKCTAMANENLLEMSIIAAFGACIDDMASKCDNFLYASAEACSKQRISANKAPNVLTVDFPKIAPPYTNVLAAVRQQNARNLVAFRSTCRVRVDAATTINLDRDPIFFSGNRIITYSEKDNAQKSNQLVSSFSPNFPTDIDSAVSGRYWGEYDSTYFFKGCNYWLHRNGSLTGPFVINDTFPGLECDVKAAVGVDSTGYFFKGCNYWSLKRFWTIDGPYAIDYKFEGLPCDIDTGLNIDDKVYFFHNNNQSGTYWVYQDTVVTQGTSVMDWNIDPVWCEN